MKDKILKKLNELRFTLGNIIADVDELTEEESVPGNKLYRFERGNTEHARDKLSKALDLIYQAAIDLRSK